MFSYGAQKSLDFLEFIWRIPTIPAVVCTYIAPANREMLTIWVQPVGVEWALLSSLGPRHGLLCWPWVVLGTSLKIILLRYHWHIIKDTEQHVKFWFNICTHEMVTTIKIVNRSILSKFCSCPFIILLFKPPSWSVFYSYRSVCLLKTFVYMESSRMYSFFLWSGFFT